MSFDAHRCTCVAEFANGVCECDYITEFETECTVMESSQNESLGGDCDIDVDVSASSPCVDGAACTESAVESEVSFHTYWCTCVAAFANGVCECDYITEFETECTKPVCGRCSMDGVGSGV